MNEQKNQQMDRDGFWMTKAILDKCKTPFFRLGPKGQVEYVNQAACDSLGYTNDELVGKFPWDFDPDFKQDYWPGVWERLRKHETVHINSIHQRKDGTCFDVEVTGHFISTGSEEFSFTFVQNVTERKAAEETIRQKESYLRALIDNFPFMVWLKDKDGKFLTVNQAHAEAYGFQSPEDVAGKTDFDLCPHDLAQHYRTHDNDIMIKQHREILEEQYQGPEGRSWIETFKAPVIGANQQILGTVGFARDITERKLIEAELRITAAIFNSQVGMVVTDKEGLILKVNEAFTQVTQYNLDDVLGKRINILSSDIHQPNAYDDIWKAILGSGGWQGELWNKRKNGSIYPQWLTITAVKGVAGEVDNYVATLMDITHRKALEEKLQRLAHYDALTDLPNRILLMDRLNAEIAQAKRGKTVFGLMYMDLDGFKEINDEFGHSVGDTLLQEVAIRLQHCFKRGTDTVSRISGDEFVALIPNVRNTKEAISMAETVLKILNKTFDLDGNIINISVSIGIAFFPLNALDAESLLKTADVALYEAKGAGKNRFAVAHKTF